MSEAAPTAASPTLVDRVRAAVNAIADPCSIAAGDALGLDDMGLLDAIAIDGDGDVSVRIRLTSPTCVMVGLFATEIEDRVGVLPGVRQVVVSFDGGLDWRPDLMSSQARRRRAERLAQARLRYAGALAAARQDAVPPAVWGPERGVHEETGSPDPSRKGSEG
jgi:metal-sulfur cluster biosynthetic enzyme